MAEYIERDKVYNMLNALGGCGAEPESWSDGWDKAFDEAIRELDNIPAADVRPERHGRWIEDEKYGIVICSECGEEHAWEDYRASYCEDCGAKRDGEDGENNGV